jgi:hypothetical protein
MPAERVIGPRERNRALLARQGLLERLAAPLPRALDGTVAGTWRHEGGRIRLAPFGRLTRAARAELGEEGERLAALHA